MTFDELATVWFPVAAEIAKANGEQSSQSTANLLRGLFGGR